MNRHRRIKEDAELNVTSFMNLMIVLVPVLLLNMVFAQVSVIDLKLPLDQDNRATNTDDISLEVVIDDNRVLVQRTLSGQSEVVATLKNVNNQPDVKRLSSVLQDIKRNPIFADRTDISLLSSPSVNYQTLITVMDTVRAYTTVVAASAVEAVLFPDISLGDAPDNTAQARVGEQ